MINDQEIKKLLVYRWAVWGVLVLAFIIVFFQRLSLGVVSGELIAEFEMSSTLFANLGSMYFYAYMFMQIPSGILADTIGARKTVSYGTLLAAIGSVMFGWAPNVTIAFIARFLVGIGVSVVFISILKIQSQWFFEREFATMSGLTAFMGNLGGFLAQAPLAFVVGYLSWRMAFIYIGVASFIVALLCYIIVRNTPLEMGLPKIEEIDQKRKKEPILQRPPLMKTIFQVLKNKHIWPPFLLFAGVHGAFIALTGTWGVSYLVDVYGLTSKEASNYTSIAVLGLGIGSYVIGKVSDIINKRKLPTIIYMAVATISWGVLTFTNGAKPPLITLYPIFFFIGFSCAAFVMCWACGKETSHPTATGIATSVVNTGGFVGAAILPPILGKVFDRYEEVSIVINLVYQRAFIYCFGFALVAFIISLFIKETYCKNIYNKLQ